jgi:fermentation-respiration switch protein FrsA (DUF1100 family)
MKVLFLHGLEGSPTGEKPRRLRAMAGVEVVAPALPTGPLQAWRASHPQGTAPVALVEPALEVATEALRAGADVVVGSSFGGGLALMLTVSGAWSGPLVLLAPAGVRAIAPQGLRERSAKVVVLHGRADEVVPVDDSLQFARQSRCGVTLWLVDDDHRLSASVAAGLLDDAVRFVCP